MMIFYWTGLEKKNINNQGNNTCYYGQGSDILNIIETCRKAWSFGDDYRYCRDFDPHCLSCPTPVKV